MTEVEHRGEVKVTLEAREAVVRRLERWTDSVRRDALDRAGTAGSAA